MKNFKFLRENPLYDSAYETQRKLYQKIINAANFVHQHNIRNTVGQFMLVSATTAEDILRIGGITGMQAFDTLRNQGFIVWEGQTHPIGQNEGL